MKHNIQYGYKSSFLLSTDLCLGGQEYTIKKKVVSHAGYCTPSQPPMTREAKDSRREATTAIFINNKYLT